MVEKMVKCGECEYFVRNGQCNYLRSPEGRRRDKPFAQAPFWVWSDCYSDKEQVFEHTETLCPVFKMRASPQSIEERSDEVSQHGDGLHDTNNREAE